MSRHAGKIVLNGATSQANRWLPALGDGYANVDDRSLSDLLAFSVGFGRLIRFYDLDDRPDGDWSGFFAADPAIVLACIAALRPDRAERAFVELQRQALEARHFAPKFERLTLMFDAVMQLARLANDWLEGLGPQPQSPTARLLRAQLVAAIEASLGPHLRRLSAYAEGAGQHDALGQPIPLDLAGFLPIWRLTHDCPDASIYRGASRNRRIDHACPAIHALFTQCLDALGNLQARAHSEFDASLDSADHPPQTALYIAFAELFRTAQDTVNTVSSRFARFYYHDMLHEDFRPAQPDSTYLTFVLADDESVTSSSVPQQTLFAAGQDASGLDILFKADRSLLVTSAAIARLRALRVMSGPLIPGHAAPRTSDVIQRVIGTEITTDPKANGAWPTFGYAEPGATDTTLTTPATIGFAIASPYLLLTGGDREIKLRSYYSQDAAARLAPLLAMLAEATGLDDAEIWTTVLSQAFTLQVSTITGWKAIEQPYDVRLVESSAGDPGFELKFTLPAAAPAVEAYAPDTAAADGANPDPARPTVKALVNPSQVLIGVKPCIAEVYPLSLLCELDCTGWQIETHVAGLTELQLSNTDGTIDASKPFLPFGAPVVKGSYLKFFHRELFVKTLHSLQITITWFNLPPNDDGFDGWYCDYVLGMDGTPQPNLFDNTVFKADIDVVDPGTWQLDGGDALCLFRTHSLDGMVPDCQDTEAAAPLCPSTCYDQLTIIARNAPAYYDPADSTVRIRLVAPVYAFGDDLYAANVLNAVINDLPPTTPTPDPPPFSYPNAPWLPQAESVSVDYVAIVADADAGAGQFFHLMPFDGVDEVQAPVASLLPRLRDSGNLYIGLDGLGPSQPLTLLFQMTTAGGDSGPLPPVQWQYLRNNRWIALTPEQVLGDGTNGLQNSGVLSLALPAMTGQNTLLGSGQWLGASVPRGAARFPLTSHITPHAMLATWVDNGSIDHLAQPLPAQTITASVQDLPDIASIDQPMPSFGGRPPETGRSFQTWIGERLRHKDRGILGWDYERLVLEDLPTIWKVQALPARSLAHGDSPGDVLVVVVPGPNGYEAMDPTAPMASADLLARIHAMLVSRISPFIRLRVSNPVYVRITVSACAQFSDNDGASIDRLNADLVHYLSPWFDDAARAAKAGDYASEDEISEFIQTRSYVDALITIRFDYAPDPRQLDWYFLTTAPQHNLTLATTTVPTFDREHA